MNWIKSNAMPLAVGAALGYWIAKKGGIHAAVGSAKRSVGG